MPKNKDRKKAKNERDLAASVRNDSEKTMDTDEQDEWSVMSNISENSDGTACPLDEAVLSNDETEKIDLIEDKLDGLIDDLSEKSAGKRLETLKSLLKIFQRRDLLSFLESKKDTLLDAICRCLKKGKGSEQTFAVRIIMAVILRLGEDTDSDRIGTELQAIILPIFMDPTVQGSTRIICAHALSVLELPCEFDNDKVTLHLQRLESVFSQSYFKGDGHVRQTSPEVAFFHAAALDAWSVYISLYPELAVSLRLARTHVQKLAEVLESPHVEMRISAGETIALLYEVTRGSREYEPEESSSMASMDSAPKVGGLKLAGGWKAEEAMRDSLRELSTDASRFRAKRDRRSQRASFRDILDTVVDAKLPLTSAKFGKDNVYLRGWRSRIFYNSVALALEDGLHMHVKMNGFVRQMLQLGPVCEDISGAASHSVLSRKERHLIHKEQRMERQRRIGNVRDKRADVGY